MANQERTYMIDSIPQSQPVDDLQFQVYRQDYVCSNRQPVTAIEADYLKKIFKILSQANYVALCWNKAKIDKMQEKVSHVHPLNFIEALHADPELKSYFESVKSRGGIIWKKCLDRFIENTKIQHSLNNLKPHLEPFSNKLGLDLNEVIEFADAIDAHHDKVIEFASKI